MGSGELVGVGAFAQLSGLTVETLRHYHQVGLLVPAEVDGRTGYRRYGLRQLPRARTLAALRDVGTSACRWRMRPPSSMPLTGARGVRGWSSTAAAWRRRPGGRLAGSRQWTG
jgi:hypothetical protein